MRFWNEISDRLAGLTGTATPEVARAALNEFDVRDIQAVRVSEGGGGGGSQSVEIIGPINVTRTSDLAAGVVITSVLTDDVVIAAGTSVITSWGPIVAANATFNLYADTVGGEVCFNGGEFSGTDSPDTSTKLSSAGWVSDGVTRVVAPCDLVLGKVGYDPDNYEEGELDFFILIARASA